MRLRNVPGSRETIAEDEFALNDLEAQKALKGRF